MTHFDTASHHVTAAVLAAAWRENLADIRHKAHHTPPGITIPLHTGTLRFTATTHAFDQITPTSPITFNHTPITTPVQLLHAITPTPTTLDTELTDAVEGLAAALSGHHRITDALAEQAATTGADTTIELARQLTTHTPHFLPCRFFEPLAVEGHHLHPLARTRLGWTPQDRHQYDLETAHPINIRFIAAHRALIAATADPHGHHLDTLLARQHPALDDHLDDDHHLIPLHPWQHDLITTRYAEHFTTGALRQLPGLHIPTSPTASIRTLVTDTGHYLKCSLDIHITSTRRGISPATVHNGPILSPLITTIINTDPTLASRIAILPEHAGLSLPTNRDLSALLRGSLNEITTGDELAIPATALTATSPVTGHSIATELIDTAADHTAHTQHNAATDFIHHYADLLITATTRLAGHYGIGSEAHLQNCVPTFTDGQPRRIIIRDLGGARLHLPRLHDSGHRPQLHPDSITTTDNLDTMRAKVGYTVFQNHLAAIINTLHKDRTLPAETAWRIVTDTLHNTDIPTTDLDYYTATTTNHKALLTMRIHTDGDHYVPVANPLNQP